MTPVNVQALEIFALDVLERASPPGAEPSTVMRGLISPDDQADIAAFALAGDALADVDQLAFSLLDEPEAAGGVLAVLADEADETANAAAEPISDLLGGWLPSSAFLIGVALCHAIRKVHLRLGSFELTVETREILGPNLATWMDRFLARRGERLVEIVANASKVPQDADQEDEDDTASDSGNNT